MPGKPVDLLEPSLLGGVHNLQLEEGVLVAQGDDPFMIFKLQQFVGFGCYVLDLNLEEISGDIRPRLYFHARHGFNQRTSELMRRTGPGHYRLYILVSGTIKAIRLDPADYSCKFRLRQFTLRRASLRTFFARVSRNGENPGFEKPQIKRTHKSLHRLARHGISFERIEKTARSEDRDSQYRRWIALYDFHEAHLPVYRQRLDKLKSQPLISIVMPVYNTPPEVLAAAVESVRTGNCASLTMHRQRPMSVPHFKGSLSKTRASRLFTARRMAISPLPRIRLSNLPAAITWYCSITMTS
jgi:O-antigen biosynthesis protein